MTILMGRKAKIPQEEEKKNVMGESTSAFLTRGRCIAAELRVWKGKPGRPRKIAASATNYVNRITRQCKAPDQRDSRRQNLRSGQG